MKDPHPPDFDRVATVYRWSEYLTFGRALERTRFDLLESLPRRHHALVLGDGDGRFLARLLARQTALVAVAVDTSASMLALLKGRCRSEAADATQPTVLHASALSLKTLPPGTDLIVSHFFLDCLFQPQLDQLIATLSAAAAPGTLWLLSDFAIVPSRKFRRLSAVLIRLLYFAFRITTGLRVTQLPAIEPTLLANNWHRIQRRQRLGGLLYTELWQHK